MPVPLTEAEIQQASNANKPKTTPGYSIGDDLWSKGPDWLKSGMTKENFVPVLGDGQEKLDATPDWLKNTQSRSNPLPWQTYLPDEIAGPQNNNSLAASAYRNASDPNFANRPMAGVGSDRANVGGVGDGLGSHNPMSSAISKRYEAGLGNKLSAMQTKTEANAPVAQSNELARASSMWGQDQSIAMANFKEQYAYQQQRAQLYTQWRNAQTAAENAVWGSVIGGISSVATLGIGALKK